MLKSQALQAGSRALHAGCKSLRRLIVDATLSQSLALRIYRGKMCIRASSTLTYGDGSDTNPSIYLHMHDLRGAGSHTANQFIPYIM